MKTIALLLLGSLAACTSAKTSEQSAAQAGDAQAFRMIPLQFAAAGEVVGQLRSLWPETRAVADARTNSVLLVCASEAELQRQSELVAQLDVHVKGTQ